MDIKKDNFKRVLFDARFAFGEVSARPKAREAAEQPFQSIFQWLLFGSTSRLGGERVIVAGDRTFGINDERTAREAPSSHGGIEADLPRPSCNHSRRPEGGGRDGNGDD